MYCQYRSVINSRVYLFLHLTTYPTPSKSPTKGSP